MTKIESPFRSFAAWMLILVSWTCLPARARADSSTASLAVSVTDSSGAVIPGAHLLLRNTDTNQEQQQDSGQTGLATFSFLKPGHYTLTVSKSSFADVVVDRILLDVGDEKHLQLSLKVGPTAQTVTVDASGLTINTTDASVSTVINRKYVENIPLNGRSFQDLISLTPGIVSQTPQNSASSVVGYNGDFSVNGQRTNSNYYTIDGVSGNASPGYPNGAGQAASSGSIGSSTAIGTTQSLVPVDGLQEFRVQSSTYSAEYGRSPGGQFSLITRSGTNEVHATVFDYLRNNFFDANNWFNNYYRKPSTALRQNDFGGTIGGPVPLLRNWMGEKHPFFFLSYEGLRLTQPQAASIGYVPDTAMREQAPAALQPILNAFPVQTGIDYGTSSNPNLAQFIKSYSLPSQIDSTGVRIDETLGSGASLFFRYATTPSSTTLRSLSTVTRQQVNVASYTAGVTSQWSSSVTNELRLGYSSGHAKGTISLDSFGGAKPIALGAALASGATDKIGGLFYIFIPGIGASTLSSSFPANANLQWNVVDTTGISLREHQLKFGIDYLHISSPLTASYNPYYPYFLYESPQSILQNQARAAYVFKEVNATPIFTETAAFVQDEWHLAPRLTISAGLRWEIDPPPTEANGNSAYTLLGNVGKPSTLTLAPRGTPLWKTSWYNFAPRLGLAWVARGEPGWETVLRTGGGVFFDTDNRTALNGYSGLGFYAFKSLANVSAPLTSAQTDVTISTVPPYTSSLIYAFPSHLQLPYTLQWNAAIEQAIGRPQVLTLTYVGSNGRRLLQLQKLAIGSMNPQFGTIYAIANHVTSNYQALQVQFQRTVTRGLQVLGSYTWSHSIDYGSNDSAYQVTRGDSDFDVRNNFQAGLSWDLPSIKRGKYIDAVANRWGLDVRDLSRTAFPVTLQGHLITDPLTGTQYYSNVNLLPGRPLYLYGAQYPGGRALNGGPTATSPAFVLPSTAGDPGDAPRNLARGFGESQLNAAIRRAFPVSDKLSMQFRAEAFNVLNHPVFGYVDPTLTDATFGQATQTLNQSLGTISPQYQQGGPRSMQFALKLIF